MKAPYRTARGRARGTYRLHRPGQPCRPDPPGPRGPDPGGERAPDHRYPGLQILYLRKPPAHHRRDRGGAPAARGAAQGRGAGPGHPVRDLSDGQEITFFLLRYPTLAYLMIPRHFLLLSTIG